MKRLIPLILLCTVSYFSFGQEGKKPDRAKIEELKIAFITSKLDLTVEESQKFWPVYNAQEKELRALRKNMRNSERKPLDEMTDAELEQQIQKLFEMKKKEVEIREKYFAQFKKAIPVRKYAMLHRIEQRFKKVLLEKMRGGPGK